MYRSWNAFDPRGFSDMGPYHNALDRHTQCVLETPLDNGLRSTGMMACIEINALAT